MSEKVSSTNTCQKYELPIAAITCILHQRILHSSPNLSCILVQFWTIRYSMSEAPAEGAPLDPAQIHDFVLRVGEGLQHGRYPLLGLYEQMFEVQQHALLHIFVDECGGHTGLAASTCIQV